MSFVYLGEEDGSLSCQDGRMKSIDNIGANWKIHWWNWREMWERISYALDDSAGSDWPGRLWNPNWLARLFDWCTRAKCRFLWHPWSVVWYNPGGYEPNMRCSNCGEDLG